MKLGTKDKLLFEAEILFSEKGFYGTSINDIAARVNVSKQALLHHFKTKEKIYAAVLEGAAGHLHSIVIQAAGASKLPWQQLATFFTAMNQLEQRELRLTILLMRELLDNRERSESAHKWFLRPFLDALVAIVEQGQKIGEFKAVPAFAFVYQLLGASQYYLISLPTLKQLYSEAEFAQLQNDHQQLQLQMIESLRA